MKPRAIEIVSLDKFMTLNLNEISIFIKSSKSGIFKQSQYTISITIPSLEFCGEATRQFDQFSAFYEALKVKFSNFSFPTLPSGFLMFKKVEKKRKYFEQLLRSVLELAKTHEDIKGGLLKILYRFIFNEGCEVVPIAPPQKIAAEPVHEETKIRRDSLPTEVLATPPRPSSHKKCDSLGGAPLRKISSAAPENTILSEHKENPQADEQSDQPFFLHEDHAKGLYSLGYMEVKMKSNPQWVRLYAKIVKGRLLLYKSFRNNNFVVNYVLYKTEAELIEDEDLGFMLILYHEYDNDYLMLKGMGKENLAEIRHFILQENEKLYKEIITKVDETNKYSMGKLSLQVYGVEDFPYSGASVSVKISLDPYVLETKESSQQVDQCCYDINQQFLVVLKLDVVNNKHEGVLRDTKKEMILNTIKIPIPDLSQDPYTSGRVRIPFKVTQIKKSGLLQSPTPDKVALYESQVSHLILQVKYISGVNAWWSSNPNKKIAEERRLTDDFNLKEMKLTLKRLHRMYLYLVYLNQLKHEIFKYKYPRFSNLCFILLTLLILLYNPAQILGTITAIMLVLLAINNPTFRQVVDPIMNKYFFREDLLNPYAIQKVKSLKEFEEENIMQRVYSAEAKKLENDDAKKAAKLKKKEGIYKSFKRIYLSLLHTFGQTCDFLEKFKNLFLWKDAKRSRIMFYFILAFLFFFYLMPIRYIILMLTIRKFWRGRRYYRKKYRSNKEILRIYLSDFVKQNMKNVEFNPKSNDLFISKGNEQKLIGFLYNNANICLTPEIVHENNSPKKLVKYCAYTKCVLKLSYERDKVKRLFKTNPRLYKSSIEEYELLFNYIGHIPSDYYRFKYSSPEAYPIQ